MVSVYLLSDIELTVRGRMFRPPEGPHVAVVKGRDIDAALDHLDERPDCRALAIVGAPADVPDLELLAGRRLFISDPDGAAMRAMVEAGLAVGAEVEWHRGDPPAEVLAAWALPVGAVVLAAGAGNRMGGEKLLLEIGGQPMVRHVVAAASNGGCHLVHTIYASEEVREAISKDAVAVFNPRANSGQASSLQAGLRSMPEQVAAAMVLLGDQPLVGSRTVRLLLQAWRAEGACPAIAADYESSQSSWQPPVILDRSLWPDLLELRGDEGARAWLQARPEVMATVPAAGRSDDVDTPEDYARIVELFPQPPKT
jgi:CTP:molybdopterin cytidylyltransferase MocA